MNINKLICDNVETHDCKVSIGDVFDKYKNVIPIFMLFCLFSTLIGLGMMKNVCEEYIISTLLTAFVVGAIIIVLFLIVGILAAFSIVTICEKISNIEIARCKKEEQE